MTIMGMTYRMKDALDFIKDYQFRTGGVSPSVREIAKGLNLSSTSFVHGTLLTGLEERGLIRRLPNRARSIEVVRPRYVAFQFDDTTKALERYGPS